MRDAGKAMHDDLEALRAATARDLPSLDRTLREASAARRGLRAREDLLVTTFRKMKMRPLLSTALAGGAVAAALLLVPVSYQSTIGHTVTLSLELPARDPEVMRETARALKAAVGADQVRVIMEGEGAPAARFVAESPVRSAAQVEAAAEACVRALGSRGLRASHQVAPRRERVSGNVYAMAGQRMIELTIRREGRTPAEIEADIVAQLEAAGVSGASVQVSQDGDRTRIEIRKEGPGEEGGEEQLQMQVQLEGGDAAGTPLHMIRVEKTPGMTDADVRAEVERQMRELGLEGEVSVQDGRIEIRCEKQN